MNFRVKSYASNPFELLPPKLMWKIFDYSLESLYELRLVSREQLQLRRTRTLISHFLLFYWIFSRETVPNSDITAASDARRRVYITCSRIDDCGRIGCPSLCELNVCELRLKIYSYLGVADIAIMCRFDRNSSCLSSNNWTSNNWTKRNRSKMSSCANISQFTIYNLFIHSFQWPQFSIEMLVSKERRSLLERRLVQKWCTAIAKSQRGNCFVIGNLPKKINNNFFSGLQNFAWSTILYERRMVRDTGRMHGWTNWEIDSVTGFYFEFHDIETHGFCSATLIPCWRLWVSFRNLSE